MNYKYAEEKKEYEVTGGHPYSSDFVDVELFIGGREHVAVAVPLILKIHPNNLKEVIPLINRIEQIHIRSHDFKSQQNQQLEIKDRLELLTVCLHDLMSLPCLRQQKKEINDATCLFFEMVLENIRLDSVPVGTPMYPGYLKQLSILDEAVQTIVEALQKNDFNVERTGLPLINPITVNLQSFKNLPQSLIDFDKSLDNPAMWRIKLQEFANDVSRFNQYALLIQARIHSMHDDDRRTLRDRIHAVVVVLRSHSLDKMLVDAFEDIAVGAASPRRLQRVNTLCQARESVYDMTLDELKSKINHLNITANFSDDFLAFRQSLSSKLGQYSAQKQLILQELKQHLCGFDKSRDNISRVVMYIDASIQRINQPLSENLSTAHAELISRYDLNNSKLTDRQKCKSNFLAHWMNEINRSPEKTYGECYDTVKRSSDKKTRALLDERRHLFFSGKQHFKTFEKDLIEADAYLISSVPTAVGG